MEKSLRKASSDLTLSGIGAAAFGIWYFVKTILYILFAQDYINSMLAIQDTTAPIKAIALSLWLFQSFITMLLHLYIGLCAASEGTGKRDFRRGYLVLSGLLLLGNGYSLVFNFRAFASMGGSLLEQVCDIMMEGARMANLSALLRAAGSMRKLSRETQKEAIGHAD